MPVSGRVPVAGDPEAGSDSDEVCRSLQEEAPCAAPGRVPVAEGSESASDSEEFCRFLQGEAPPAAPVDLLAASSSMQHCHDSEDEFSSRCGEDVVPPPADSVVDGFLAALESDVGRGSRGGGGSSRGGTQPFARLLG